MLLLFIIVVVASLADIAFGAAHALVWAAAGIDIAVRPQRRFQAPAGAAGIPADRVDTAAGTGIVAVVGDWTASRQ